MAALEGQDDECANTAKNEPVPRRSEHESAFARIGHCHHGRARISIDGVCAEYALPMFSVVISVCSTLDPRPVTGHRHEPSSIRCQTFVTAQVP